MTQALRVSVFAQVPLTQSYVFGFCLEAFCYNDCPTLMKSSKWKTEMVLTVSDRDQC